MPPFRAALLLALLFPFLAACDAEPGSVGHLVRDEAAQPVVVPTAAGPVRGAATAQGQAFLGIPFAAPPTGLQRWKPPQPPAAWDEPRDATRLGSGCVQNFSPAYQKGESSSWMVQGDEDCLNLNIYAPAGAAQGATEKAGLPVMVWLYGGAWVLGSNRQYDLSRLAQEQGVVVVAPNYRLGTLGFLSHPELRAAAGGATNLALLDQQAALAWVRDNIANFGGDPGNVTLFGESAGSWSVCLQLASPGAAGLFHRAILQSGACNAPGVTIPLSEADAGGEAMARDLGCGMPGVVPDCLANRSARELAAEPARTRGPLGPRSWAAVVGDSVLPLDPAEAFRTGQFNRVPVLAGTNRDEGNLFSVLYRLTGELFTTRSYDKAVSRLLADRAEAAKRLYAGEASPALSFGSMITDGFFICPTLALNQSLAEWAEVHAYEFADRHAVSRLPSLPFLPPLGAYHAGEIAYVFRTPWLLADPAAFNKAQDLLSRRMQHAWGRFAHGMPPEEGWPGFQGDEGAVMAFAPEGSALRRDMAAAHRCGAWNSLGL